MKLARFQVNEDVKVGRIEGNEIVDLSSLNGGSASMREFLEKLPSIRAEAEAMAGPRYALSDVSLLAPIDDPQKFLAIGMNYKAHAEEARAAGIPVPESQLWFNKQVSCIAGPYDPTVMPNVSDMLDYEAELGFVIGTKCRHVKRSEAHSVIAGYFVANDVSVRDWQMRSPTFTLGKSFDTHGPIGPWITTSDEIADPENLELKMLVDGEVRQHANTSDLIYKIADQVEYLSTVMTLQPGDLILTGTPSGVGAATLSWLKVGQVCRVEIEGLGAIENTIVAES